MALAFALGGASSACLVFGAFECSEAAQCDRDDQQGTCQPTGFCSYPDGSCPSMQRYDDAAGDGLGGTCVDLPGTGTDVVGNTEPTDTDPDTTNPTDTDPVDPTVNPSDTTADSGSNCGGAGQACCAGDECEDGLACLGSGCGCATQIAAGYRHTCVIKVDGTVWCWGDNMLGQMGNTINPREETPVQVSAATIGPAMAATAIDATNHTCALRDDDTAFCWGDNRDQKADVFSVAPNVPSTPVTWAANARLVATGQQHSCAGQSMGTVATCWGANARGQLANAGVAPGPYSTPGIFEFERIELGGEHGCGYTMAGILFCWGDNQFGQLGIDTATAMAPTLEQVTIGVVTDIAVGRSTTCAIVSDRVQCFGLNDLGQMGDGTGANQFMPTDVALPPAIVVVAIDSGPDHTCALTDSGDVFCWGSNMNDQWLLDGPQNGGNTSFALGPIELEELADTGADVVQLAGGLTHGCAIMDDGFVRCWGPNTRGQVGDGSTAYAFDPEQVELECP